jgi:ABC-type branched-subunit amino acid transport system substrate-binding protein
MPLQGQRQVYIPGLLYFVDFFVSLLNINQTTMWHNILKCLIPALLLTGLLFSCEQTEKKKKSGKTLPVPEYTIGVNLPLTGNGSYFAEEVKKGLDLSFGFVNDSSRRMSIKVLYEDNMMNPRDAVGITKKFLEIEKVDLLIMGYTPLIQATIGLVNDHRVPALVTLSSVEDIAAPYEWVFRDFEMESRMMPMMAEYAFDELGLRSGSWLVVNDDMGRDVVRYFSESFEALGGNMMEGEVFEPTETGLRNKVSKVLARDPGFVIVIGRGSALINACRQIRERMPELPLFSNNTVDNDDVWQALGPAGNNIWFPRPFTDRSGKRYNRINEQFVARYGHEMNWLNVYGISIANYLVRGLQASGGEPEKMKEYLRTLRVESIRGLLVMGENSDVLIPHEVYRRKNGESIPAKADEQ